MLKCRVITPDKAFYDGEAEKIVVPGSEGQLSFRDKHLPLIARLGYGVLSLEKSGSSSKFVIYGGFVRIKNNEVIVLAGGAEDLAAIDRDQAKAEYEAAQKTHREQRPPKVSEIDFAEIEEQLARAEVRYKAVAKEPVPIHSV